MKRNKIVIYILAMCIWSYLQIGSSGSNDLLQVYNGVVFNSTVGHYVRCFFLFACYCLYTYNEFEPYIKEYGVILVTREASRDKLVVHLIQRLLKFVIQIEGIKITSYVIVMLFMKKSITISSPIEFLRSLLLNILVYLLILLIQMIIEIWCSGNLAIVSSMVAFVMGIGVSDFIERTDFVSNKINVFIVQNLTMRIRVESLINDERMLLLIAGVLWILLANICILIKVCFRKKDIM